MKIELRLHEINDRLKRIEGLMENLMEKKK